MHVFVSNFVRVCVWCVCVCGVCMCVSDCVCGACICFFSRMYVCVCLSMYVVSFFLFVYCYFSFFRFTLVLGGTLPTGIVYDLIGIFLFTY